MASEQNGHRPDGPDLPRDEHAGYDPSAALDDLDTARAQFGRALVTPWWYKLTSALIVLVLFVGLGMPYGRFAFGSVSIGASLAVLTLALGPLLLRDLLKRSTGASLDRYRGGWTLPSLALVALLVTCACLQRFAGVDSAPLVGGVVGFVFTWLYERWVDHRLASGEFPSGQSRRAAA